MIWDFDPIAFSLFGFSVRWYGLGYLVGFFLVQYGGWAMLKKSTSQGITNIQWENIVFGSFIAGVIGGRFGEFLFYSPHYFWTDPFEVFKIWKGGMSIHGGFLGTMVYLLYFCKKKSVSFFRITDTFVLPLSFALGIGRITNFINGELVGIPTGKNWGVLFPHVDALLRHPSQLYEAVSMFFIGIILFIVWKIWKKIPVKFFTILFLFLYGVFRFIVEFWKDAPVVLGSLTMGQILCVGMIIFAGILSFSLKNRLNQIYNN